MSPAVGSEVTASLTDPDGGITGTTWQWSKSLTMDGTFTDIDTATSMAYTPAEADEGYYLKVTASYTDGEGTGKMATFTSQSAVVGVGAVGPVQTYDTNKDGDISIAELFVAIDAYFRRRDQHSRAVRGHRRLLRITQLIVGCRVFARYPTADDPVMCTARPHLIGTKERTRFM